MTSDHSDSRRGSLLQSHGLLFLLSSNASFICSISQDRTYHGLCYTSRGTLAGMRNSSMRDRSNNPSHHKRTLYIAALYTTNTQKYKHYHIMFNCLFVCLVWFGLVWFGLFCFVFVFVFVCCCFVCGFLGGVDDGFFVSYFNLFVSF